MIRIKMLLLCCAAIGLSSAPSARAQSSEGTDFYLGNMVRANPTLYVSGKTSTSGTVEIPGLKFSQAFLVNPGTVTSVALPAINNVYEGIPLQEYGGIHVTTQAPVSVYGLSNSMDGWLGLPFSSLGREYIALGYNGGDSDFLIVATKDGTKVTITPSFTFIGDPYPAGVPYTITLDRLRTYHFGVRNIFESISRDGDVSGTIISSTEPVALFSGSQYAEIPTINFGTNGIVEQIPPTASWGSNFLTVPMATRQGGDTYRIIARDPGTSVSIDGKVVASLGRAQIYQSLLSSTANHSITATKPVLVAQYSNGHNFDNVPGAPSMMLITPTEQFQGSYTVFTLPPYEQTNVTVTYTNYINVVAKTSDVSLCRLDGGLISTFLPVGTTGYSGAQNPVGAGAHNVSCPNGAGVYVYRFTRTSTSPPSFSAYSYPGGLGGQGQAGGAPAASRCDVNGDKQIDIRDINLIFTSRNKPAAGNEDPMDADGDLQITVADARTCQQRCTNASCAVQ